MESSQQWSNIGAEGGEHLYYRSQLQAKRGQKTRRSPRSYFSFSTSVFLTKRDCTCDPDHARLFIENVCVGQVFSSTGRFFLENNQNGTERGRRTTTLPRLCNHDVDEQQTAFQYAPHPPRTQIRSSALQLRGHPQGLPAHTVGEFKNHFSTDFLQLPICSKTFKNPYWNVC